MSENTAGKQRAQLGAVQQTLFIPLAARARETAKKRPVLRDPRAAELAASIDFDADRFGRGFGGIIMVLRTAVYDFWVRQFLAGHPAGTVVELGTGLNTRFDRVDNGQVHWIDLDLPDTIELRSRFFTDTSRRRMIPSSVLSEEWLPIVADSPGPYFFVTEGVLTYLPEQDVTQTLARLAARFPGARLALDTYPQRHVPAPAPAGRAPRHRALAVAVRRPAVAAAARPAAGRVGHGHPATTRHAPRAATGIPVPAAAAGRPGAGPELRHAQPVHRHRPGLSVTAG